MTKLLNAQQTADMLNIAIGTIYAWVHRKKIPYIKTGKKLAFKEADILKYIESNSYYPE